MKFHVWLACAMFAMLVSGVIIGITLALNWGSCA